MSLFYVSKLFCQTVLNTYPIDLNIRNESNKQSNIEHLYSFNDVLQSATSGVKNTLANSQILSIVNESTNEVFVFIKDSKQIRILKYNRALFLKSEYVYALKDLEDKVVMGCGFSEDGNPTLYLKPNVPDSKIPLVFIIAVKFELETKIHKISLIKFPVTESVLTTFQMNNSFHILAKNGIMQALAVYSFQEAKVVKKVFDFSSFSFQDRNGQLQKFNSLMSTFPIEKMEVNDYNVLDQSAQKSKVYIQKNHIILTLDHNPKNTQAFNINLENLNLSEKNFPQAVLQDPKKKSNSFYHDDKLYQLNASEKELLLDIKDFNTGETLKTTVVLNEADNSFENIPLLIQKDARKPKDIKKPKRFLEHLSSLDIGMSVFKSKQDTFITIGGIPKMVDNNKLPQSNYTNDDSGFSDFDYSSIYHYKYASFESVLNNQLELVSRDNLPLALDKQSFFLSKNKKIVFNSSFKFKDYYVLAYYDTKAKQFVMRKFTDGYD